MKKIFLDSIYGSIMATLLYLVLFYPLVLIHRFDWYDMLLVTLSISPGIFIMFFIYHSDEYDKEPVWLLATCFILGAINLHFDVDILEFVFSYINVENNFLRVGGEALTVSITEEMLKFIVVFLIIFPNKSFDEPFDGIVYSVFVGMGFATAENITYVLQGSSSVAFFRMLTAVPAHFAFAVSMGYYLGKAKTCKVGKKWFYVFLSLFVSITMHAFYDYFLFLDFVPGIWLGGVATLGVAILFARMAILEHLAASPFKK